ncbi:hypothetical protein B4U80_08654 [Leptotrombidium deliense]|uniref:Transmembrane protein 9-like protein n=1 Tax=Leptotrombidium deliense TaxID=299467 RepID=A0A443SSA5_9ACAR|nr:hypothetical protein B4U80_08654 [Leptotrombidium deliense]
MDAMSALKFAVFLLLTFVLCVEKARAQYDDYRCKCICPSPSVVATNSGVVDEEKHRKVYIDNVSNQKCTCDWIVLIHLNEEIQQKAKEFCPLCECKYESRNTGTIKWVVIFVVGVVAFLVVYMGFLMLLDPFMHKSPRNAYQEQINDEMSLEEQTSSGIHSVKRSSSATEIIIAHPQNNVLNRVNQQQSKWKKQVQEQRKNIYDKHTMLN